ncbi:MAG: DedA family protein [Candidatus Hydrogenedentota bacterium]
MPMRHVKRLYDWVLSWADTPYGGAALFVLAFAESSFFPVPPDVLLIALCLGNREKWFRFAMLCTVASLLGGLVGYAIGWGLWHLVDQLFFSYVPGFTEAQFERVRGLYEQWNFWIVFIAAFTPIPYKVITVSAGVFGINVVMFAIASCVGRAARFFIVSYLLHRYGEPIHGFIEKRFNLLTVAFVVLLLGGFVILRYVGH